jgi:queuine tRNA-ribosyltransferase
MLGSHLMTVHNLTFYQALMQGLREAIATSGLEDFVASFLEHLALGPG